MRRGLPMNIRSRSGNVKFILELLITYIKGDTYKLNKKEDKWKKIKQTKNHKQTKLRRHFPLNPTKVVLRAEMRCREHFCKTKPREAFGTLARTS